MRIGFEYLYCTVLDQNGDVITSGQIAIYVYGADEKMKLSARCKTVEREAFKNTDACYLVVPAGVELLESGAFYGNNFDVVVFTGENNRIAEDAFGGYPAFFCL